MNANCSCEFSLDVGDNFKLAVTQLIRNELYSDLKKWLNLKLREIKAVHDLKQESFVADFTKCLITLEILKESYKEQKKEDLKDLIIFFGNGLADIFNDFVKK